MNFKDEAGARTIFTIRADGTVDVPGMEFLDELSRAFWSAVGESNPLKARVEELEAHWRSLQSELEAAKRHRENRGGQHVGIPDFICIPPSALNRLLRDCRVALSRVSPVKPEEREP
jgi:hypothetical protein